MARPDPQQRFGSIDNAIATAVDMFQVIQVSGTRGDGSPDRPRREVQQYWMATGELLAEFDPEHDSDAGHPAESAASLKQRVIDAARQDERTRPSKIDVSGLGDREPDYREGPPQGLDQFGGRANTARARAMEQIGRIARDLWYAQGGTLATPQLELWLRLRDQLLEADLIAHDATEPPEALRQRAQWVARENDKDNLISLVAEWFGRQSKMKLRELGLGEIEKLLIRLKAI